MSKQRMATRSSTVSSPEEYAITKCYKRLVLCIQQSPEDTVVELVPHELLTRRLKRYIDNLHEDTADKARRIVDCILDRLAQCVTSGEREEVYRQFTGALFDPNERVRKQLRDKFKSYQQPPNVEDQITQWEERYTKIVEEGRIKYMDVDEDESFDHTAEELKRLRKLKADLKQLAERIKKLRGELGEDEDSCLMRVNKDEESLQHELDKIDKQFKLLSIRKDIQKKEKEFATSIENMKKKEEEWGAR